MKFLAKSLLPLRSHLVPDAARFSFQGFFENALEKTRKFFQLFYKNENLNNSHHRLQHRIPSEFLFRSPQPRLATKKSLFSYQPGFIQRATSRWATDSLAGKSSSESRKRILRGYTGPLICFVGFTLAKKPSLLTDDQELEGVSYEIRDAFARVPWKVSDPILQCASQKDNFNVNDLKIGDLVAKGCNAAVYSACWNNETESPNVQNEKEEKLDESTDKLSHSEVCPSVLEDGASDLPSLCIDKPRLQIEKLEPFNLAVKVMFNYSAESNAFAIWRAMHKEMLPAVLEFSSNKNNKIVQNKRIQPHPNIVQMYFGFADRLPLLPGAFSNYPHALPARLLMDGCGRNMTLFLVMKRYHCSLKDYLNRYEPSSRTSLLLLTQLLEGLVHLLQHGVAHRDLKTDNILLDLSDGIHHPCLAITDFGCCHESLKLVFPSDSIDKGGNMALMAPEVVNVEAGPFSTINYSRSDLWTAGTLAYEIFGGVNPFSSSETSLNSSCFADEQLPSLSNKAPMVVKKLVKDMLHVDPTQRPTQNFAATVCQLVLHAPPELLSGPYSRRTCRKALQWMFLMAAETYLQATMQPTKKPTLEFELRRTFCTRIQFSEVVEALRYILDT